MDKYKNLQNRKFGKLKPVHCKDDRYLSKSIWICQCDCGKFSKTRAYNLISGKTTSCGCSRYKKINPIKRFNKFFKKSGKDKCWKWEGGFGRDDYGSFYDGKNQIAAHRFSYIIHNKVKLKTNELVCHICDNPKCVNPDHLFIGSYQDNVDDAVKKKRHAFGEKVGTSKLREKDTILIKQLLKYNCYSHRELSILFNISKPAITSINRGRTWKHITI